MNVKPARAEDLVDLIQMVTEYQDEYEAIDVTEESVTEKFLKDMIAEDKRGAMLIARTSSGHAVGFATIYLCPFTRNASLVATMVDLFVRPDYRTQGFGRQLFDYAVKWAKARKYRKMVWSVENLNLTAQYMFDRVKGAAQVGWIGYTLDLNE